MAGAAERVRPLLTGMSRLVVLLCLVFAAVAYAADQPQEKLIQSALCKMAPLPTAGFITPGFHVFSFLFDHAHGPREC